MSEEKKKMSLGKKILIGVGIYFAIGIVAAGIISQTDSFKNADNARGGEAEKVSAPKIAWKKSGMYKVGTDIQAGEYLIEPQGEAAYYAVSKNSSGSMDSIITNDLLAGCSVFVTVKNGQYLEIQSAKFTGAEKYEVHPANPLKQGMYRVGRDIAAGEYKITSGGENSYYAVQKDSYNIINSIVANDVMFEGTKYITVRDGQYLLLKGCSAVRVE